MREEFINPLKEFKERIAYVSDTFPGYLVNKLKESGIHLNETIIELGKKESWIDWNRHPGTHSFYYDFEDNEDVVRNWLRNSKLKEYPSVVMEFGNLSPISEIPLDIFIDYWYELVIISGYESVITTGDGKLFMEFIKFGYTLKSNFLINPKKQSQ